MNSIFSSYPKRSKLDAGAIFRIAAILYTLALAIVIFLNDYKETNHLFFIFATVQHLDKLGHLFVMGSFSFVVNLALKARNFRFGKLEYLQGSLVVLAIATTEECSQLFLASRTFEFTDMFFNTLGVILFGEFARLLILLARSVRQKFDLSRQSVEN